MKSLPSPMATIFTTEGAAMVTASARKVFESPSQKALLLLLAVKVNEREEELSDKDEDVEEEQKEVGFCSSWKSSWKSGKNLERGRGIRYREYLSMRAI